MTAEQAERIRANRRNLYSSGSRKVYGGLLSNLGIFVCGYCGRSIRSWQGRTRNDGARTDYYGCKANELKRLCPPARMIAQQTVDERVILNVLGTLSNVEELQGYWDAAQTDQSNAPRLAAIEKQYQTLQVKKQRLVAAIVEEVLSFADGKQQRQEIDAALEELARQKKDILASIQSQPDWETLSITREEFDALEDVEKREMLFMVIREIKVFSSYLLIDYHFPRSAAGDTVARVNLPPPARPGRKVYKPK